jgi:hypothetical protein
MTPTPDPGSISDDHLTPDQLKEKLELLRLENENLKLKLQLKEQGAQVMPNAVPPTLTPTPRPQNEEADDLREETQKADELAKAHKEDVGTLVVDFFNDEIWYKGARYQVRFFPDLAKQEGWKLSKKVVAMNGLSRARNLYQYQNLSLLIYDGEDKGIFSVTAPQKDGDLDFITPEGFSFKSASVDVRNMGFTSYYKYDGMDQKDSQNVLKYKHDRLLAFGDEIQFFFTHEDKLNKIRFGILGEH